MLVHAFAAAVRVCICIPLQTETLSSEYHDQDDSTCITYVTCTGIDILGRNLGLHANDADDSKCTAL